MANVKISQLPGAGAALGTQEFEVNESGLSKKVTGSQLSAYVRGQVTLNDLGVTSTSSELNYTDGVTSAIQTQLDGKQPLDADLTAVAGLATSGLVARTGAGTAAARSIAVSGLATIADGDAVAGNPTVGVPAATQEEAEAGTDNTKVMTPLRVEQNFAANEQQIGVGQTWQSPSRSSGVTYQNTTGRPIQVLVRSAATSSMEVSSNGSTWVFVGVLRSFSGVAAPGIAIIVSDQLYYRHNGSSYTDWTELR
jgi:hypothetical protein